MSGNHEYMNNILILKKGQDSTLSDWLRANLIIELNDDGTFVVLKNKFGSEKTGKINELCNLKDIADVNN